jgi:hypothetical protein
LPVQVDLGIRCLAPVGSKKGRAGLSRTAEDGRSGALGEGDGGDGWILSRSARYTAQNAIEYSAGYMREDSGCVRRKPAKARILVSETSCKLGVRWVFLGGRVEPGSGFCVGSGVL